MRMLSNNQSWLYSMQTHIHTQILRHATEDEDLLTAAGSGEAIQEKSVLQKYRFRDQSSRTESMEQN